MLFLGLPVGAGDAGCGLPDAVGIGRSVVDRKHEYIFPAADEGEPRLRANPGIDPLEEDMTESYFRIICLDK